MKQKNKDILKNLDVLFNVGNEQYSNRQEVLFDFREYIYEHYWDIRDAERLEDYNFCAKLYKQSDLIIQSYACELDKFSSDSELQHENNVSLLECITKEIKNKILNNKKK